MSSPGIACIVGKHLYAETYDETSTHVGGWCLWCGTGTYDGDRINDDGQPIGFTPSFEIHIPEGFHRLLEDA